MRERFDLPLRLVIVDTVAAAFLVDDENNAAIATKVMQVLERIAHACDLLVLGVTHFGKAVETGVRGSSAYTASSDVIIAINAEKDHKGKVKSRSISLHKSRTRDTGIEHSFTLKSVLIGTDEDGEEIRSCYIQKGAEKDVSNSKSSKLTASQQLFIKSVDEAIKHRGVQITPHNCSYKVTGVRKEDVREVFNRNYYADADTQEKKQDAKRKQFKRMIDNCRDTYIGFEEIDNIEWIWKKDNGLTGGL